MDRPVYFCDSMVRGAFRRFDNHHHFESHNGVTLCGEVFDYTSPLGVLGKMADDLFLRHYLFRLLQERNRVVKEVAEAGRWEAFLPLKSVPGRQSSS